MSEAVLWIVAAGSAGLMLAAGLWPSRRRRCPILVLKVAVGERVCVTTPDGWRIWVNVLTGKDGHPRLGFDAPREVLVNREVVQDRVDAVVNAERERAKPKREG